MSQGISNEQLKEITNFIYSNPYCGVIAPTGSGKSTTLIQKMYESSPNERIFISEPTIPAAEGLYQRMTSLMGNVVGFAAEGNVKYNNSTGIVYCTSGHLRRKILNYFKNGKIVSGKIDFCTTIVLDEAHNGSLDIDCIIEMWKYAVNQGVIPPRLVLISATLSQDVSSFEKLPIYEIKTKSFPIKLEYIKKDYTPDNRSLYIDLAGNIVMKHYQNPVEETENSKWLVFCAGSSEVELVCSTLREAQMEKVNILPVYSSLPTEQINKIFSDVEPGYRNIIVSTNIAEASITIEGLDGVFDSMTEKVAETSASGGFRLVVKNISQSSASQRKGRTGRTKPGFCFRMCTQRLYNNLPDQREPEILRVPLTIPVIEFLNVGLNPVTLFGERVSGDRMNQTIANLLDLGLIDKDNNILEAGQFAYRLPLGVQNSAFIYQWSQLKKKDGTSYPLFPAIVLAVLIDSYGPSYYYYPPKSEGIDDEQHHREFFAKYNSQNDLKSLLLMWNDMMNNLQTIKPTYENVLFWCRDHSLNNKKIQEVIRVIRQCCLLISNRFEKVIDIGPFNEDKFLKAATPVLINVYKNRIFTKVKDFVYKDPVTDKNFRIDPKNTISHNFRLNAFKIIAVQTAEIASGKGSNNIVSVFYPL